MTDLLDRVDLNRLTDEVTNAARDAVYVAVGLGVLGFQRAQVQRVELTRRLNREFALDTKVDRARSAVSRSARRIDGLLDDASQFVESSLSPLEEQLPTTARDLAHRARAQARETRSQLLARLAGSAS